MVGPLSDERTGQLRSFALAHGMSWDDESGLPEPVCGSCGSPINVWHGDDACQDCQDCEDCCWENHAGEPHGPMTEALGVRHG